MAGMECEDKKGREKRLEDRRERGGGGRRKGLTEKQHGWRIQKRTKSCTHNHSERKCVHCGTVGISYISRKMAIPLIIVVYKINVTAHFCCFENLFIEMIN